MIITKPLTFYRLIQGDCLDVLPTMENESVDLVITSPPYNLGKDYDSYEDDKRYFDYLDFLEKVWRGCYRVLRYNGRICVNVGDINKGKFRQPTHSHIISQLERTGFKYRDIIVWNKSQTHKRTVWGSFSEPSNPYLIAPFEFVLVFSKKLFRRAGIKWGLKKLIDKKEFIKYTLSLWNIMPETGIDWHPTPFPEELPRRLIKLYSYRGDVILDPFLGSGTTMKACQDLGVSCIGIEISPNYCGMVKTRCFGRTFLDRDAEYDFEVYEKQTIDG